MPEAITIKDEPTTPLSTEDQNALASEGTEAQTQDNPDLFAGKYNSVEELEKGYRELQQKLSRGETIEEPGISESEPEQEVSSDPKEIYGEFIGTRFEENGIDFQDMNTRWQATGQLQDQDYGQLQEAGFTKDMVDSYLSGLQYRQAQDTELATRDVVSIKNEFGGESQYNEMITWASKNLTDSEQKAFNNMIKTPDLDQIRMAVAGIQANYQAQGNREPSLIGGKAARNVGERFESTAQVVAAMNDPLYKTDPAYRAKIEAKIARSNVL